MTGTLTQPYGSLAAGAITTLPASTETAAVLTVSPAEPARYAAAALALEGRLTAPDPDPPRLRV